MNLEEYIKNKNLAEGQLHEVGISQQKRHEKNAVKSQIMQAVKDKISEKRDIDVLNINEARKIVSEVAWRLVDEETDLNYGHLMLTLSDKYAIYEALIQNMFGYGAIEPFLNDAGITEVMINGPKKIFIEKDGKLARAVDRKGNPIEFTSNEELKNIIDKIVAPINRKVDESDPIVDARLPSGSRVNIVLNPVSLDGATVTIRKFPDNPYTMDQLVTFGSISEDVAELLKKMILARYNIIISGGTGSGKTTFLNALSMHIPSTARVITVEDAAELKFSQVENLVRLETRRPNIEDKGEISTRDLVKTALRMRPDRIIVGEVRDGAALDMLQAMNTGHDGSLSTGHANSAIDMLMRLETMVMMAGMELTQLSIRQQMASALDFIVHLSKLRDGTRRVVQITEIVGMKGNEIYTEDIYFFHERGVERLEDSFLIDGSLIQTGKKISNVRKFHSAGITDFSLKGDKADAND